MFVGRIDVAHLKNYDRKPKNPKPKILVAGLGNLLLRDDGVGVHAVRVFQGLDKNLFRAVDVGCAIFDALHLFEWADKILLIDAMQAGGRPGTVYRVDAIEDMESGDMPSSLHELSVIQALKIIQKTPRPDIRIIGVEPEIIDFGLELTEPVEAALPLVLETGQAIIKEWTKAF
jgi:hydrogenase maturation protease